MSAGFMNEDGPMDDPYAAKSTEEIISILTSRSDHWYNLALAFPRLYLDGFERQTLEELIGVDPARQEVWSVAGNVFHTLQVRCFPPQPCVQLRASHQYSRRPQCLNSSECCRTKQLRTLQSWDIGSARQAWRRSARMPGYSHTRFAHADYFL